MRSVGVKARSWAKMAARIGAGLAIAATVAACVQTSRPANSGGFQNDEYFNDYGPTSFGSGR